MDAILLLSNFGNVPGKHLKVKVKLTKNIYWDMFFCVIEATENNLHAQISSTDIILFSYNFGNIPGIFFLDFLKPKKIG